MYCCRALLLLPVYINRVSLFSVEELGIMEKVLSEGFCGEKEF